MPLVSQFFPTDMKMISSNEEEIKAQFSGLLVSVRETFESQRINESSVRQFLFNFFDCNKCFLSMTTFDDMFDAASLNCLWDFQHYSPLEKLAKRFLPNNQEVASLFNKYTASLTGFFSVTKVLDYIRSKQLNVSDRGESFTEQLSTLTSTQYQRISMVLEIEERVTELSLIYVHDLWCDIARQYNLPSFTAVLYNIIAGSVQITWLVLHPSWI